MMRLLFPSRPGAVDRFTRSIRSSFHGRLTGFKILEPSSASNAHTGEVLQTPGAPAATVLLLGWHGAKMKHLGKYGNLYQQRNCQVMLATMNEKALLFPSDEGLDSCVIPLARQVANVLQQQEQSKAAGGNKVPLIVHAFSGGVLPLYRLQSLIQQERHHSTNKMGDSNVTDHGSCSLARDLQLIGEHWEGEVYDSTPAVISVPNALTTMIGAFPHGFLLNFGSLLLYPFFLSKMGPKYYDSMRESEMCLKQAYIYSSSGDLITDPDQLERFISARREKAAVRHRWQNNSGKAPSRNGAGSGGRGPVIMTLKVENSSHVNHLRTHPDEYAKLVDTFLNHVVQTDSVKS